MAHHHTRPRITTAPPATPSLPESPLDRLVHVSSRAPVLSIVFTAGLALLLGLFVASSRRRRRW
jgi:hypothetical protein